ncbi:MAG: tyrosine-type recombinase/integrase [Betaproteobacteria bacterium]|nr:tyrosine-type recombinase/integrase [Betaproteobacteria bacterium]
MGKFKDMEIQAWVRAGKPIVGKSDGNGLTFTLSGNGTASWVFRYRFGGKQRELTIGNYPTISLKRARELATEARAKVQQGIDVAREKKEQKIALTTAGTVEQLCDEYYNRTVLGRVKRPEFVREILDNDLIPRIGRIRIAEVKPLDIDGMIRAVVDRGSPVMANRVLQISKAVFDYAIRRHWIEQNPAAAFRRTDAGGEEKSRTRALSSDELVKLFQALRDSGPIFTIYDLAIKLLLVTAVRKAELIEAPWAEFDLEADDPVWRLPAARTKTDRDFTIPLPSPAVEWLKEIKRTSVASDYVFPARRRAGKPTMSPETVNWALSEVKHGLAPFTLHDLRRTARTHLAALGVAPHVAERCLNHKLPGINDVYDTHDYLTERRLALNAWADLLVQLNKGETGKVVPIRNGKAA